MTSENHRPRKSLGKRIFFIFLTLACLSGITWWIICWRIEQQVEQLLHQALEKHQLTDRVNWQGIHASPLAGSVLLSDVVYQRSEHIQNRATSLRISELINQPDHFRLRLQLNEVRTVFSDEALQQLPATVSNKAKHPVDVNLWVDMDFAEDKGSGRVELLQRDSYDFAARLDISQMAALRNLLKERFPGLALSTSESVGNTALTWMKFSINGLEASLHNRGGATELAAPPEPGGFPQDILQKGWEALQKGCTYIAAIAEHAQSCQRLAEFAQGKRGSLRLIAQPNRPVPIWRLIPPGSLRALNIRLE